jgi:3-oxoacyl-[acyl-carrier protein] reductase
LIIITFGVNMEFGLKGKNVLITGGSHGIGRSSALALAKEGCNIAICARGQKGINDTIGEIHKYGVDALGISADVLIASDIDRVISKITKKWKTVHILINNIGGGGRWGTPIIEKTSEKVWIDVYNKNALAAVRFSVKLLPYMRKQKWGRIVTVSSICGCEG